MKSLEALHMLAQQLKNTNVYHSVECRENRFILVKLAAGEPIVIFLLDRDLPVAMLKKGLSDNTARGIHSLFVVWVDLLPANGKIATVRPWINMLRTLYHDRVYVYAVRDRQVAIWPVQLRSLDDSLKRQAIYLPPIDMGELACQYVETAFPIQGFWATAGFYAKKQWEPGPTHDHGPRYTSPHREAGGASTSHHYGVLGLAAGAGEEEIKAAYRQLARQFHPDLNTALDATERMQEINRAYQVLMQQFE